MRCVVQKVNHSSVKVDGKIVNEIQRGLMVLVGFTDTDTIDDINYCVKKVANLRVFEDENDVMNLSVIDVGGSVLSISQFTLYGDVKKGNRPSYIRALSGEKAKPMYEKFNELLNDGPTTIIIDSELR